MLHNAVLVEGKQTVEDALSRLEPFGDDACVVVRLNEAARVFWFVRTKAAVVSGCEGVEQAYGRGTATPLAVVLKLKSSQASNVFDQRVTSSQDMRELSGVLVRGRRLLGVLTRDAVAASMTEDSSPPETKSQVNKPLSPEEAFERLSQEQKQEIAEAVLARQAKRESRRRRSKQTLTLSSRLMMGLVKYLGQMLGKESSGSGRPDITLGGGGRGSAKGGLGDLLGGVLGGSGGGRSKTSDEADASVLFEDLLEEIKKRPELMEQTGGVRGERPNSAPPGSAGSEPPPPIPMPESTPPSPSPLPSYSVDDDVPATRPGTVQSDVVYPKLEAPERVETNVPFKLELSLTEERSEAAPDSTALNFSVVTEMSAFDLQVLVSAPGFTVTGTSFREISVDSAHYAATRETFELTATDALEDASVHTLRAQFFYKGNPIGEAFREVSVGLTPEEPLKSGSTRMNEAANLDAPDLTVVINEADQSGYLAWTLNSPHEIEPNLKDQVDNRLGSDDGKSFAHRLTKGIPLRDHNRLLEKTLLGAGRQISRVVPKQFWEALAQVWKQLEPGAVPRVLIVSNDPYIPWELATVEPPYLDASLVDAERPLILSAQVVLGRWLALASEHTAALYPRLPPPVQVKPEKMAVIVGDYLAINGLRPLPEADAEGKVLLDKYKGVKLNAVVDDLMNLMDNAVQQNGQPVDISMMHFACHGKFSVERPEDNGIVLTDDTRFDPGWAMSNSIGRETQPFAFMNACDVGAANETLGGYGGFAGAFINEGFTGFIAPLWAVNDTDAREFALEFYTKTLEQNMTVGEAVRELRAGLFANPEKPASTCVSYMLYAHPDLRLELVT